MKKIYFFAIILFSSIGSFAQSNFTQAALTAGNLVIYRVGTGAAALGSAATAVFLDEYTPAGSLVQSIPAPTAVSGLNHILTASGTATTEGLLTLSADGQYIVCAGYDASPGTASITTSASATIARVIGRLDPNGALNTTTALTDAISGSNPRGACSTNGADLWISGSAAAGGIRYAALGNTTSTSVSTTATNLRGAEIFGGQLYVSSGAGTIRLGTVGTATPTTTGQTITALPGVSITAAINQFFFADLNAGVPGVDVLYIADETANVIQKYSLVSGTWVSNGTISLATVRGLTGTVSGSSVTLYYTYSAGAKFGTLTDNTGYNAAIVATGQADLATAVTNTAFRGVAFAPAVPSTPVLSATPSTLSGYSTSLGTPSSNQSFNVNGSNLTPSGATITVTSGSPANIEVSPSGLAGTFSNSFTFTASGTTVINVPVYVRLTGTNGGSISGSVSVSGGGASTSVSVSGTVSQIFYSKSTGSLATTGTWGTATDGSGTPPADFITNGQVFIVTNRVLETLDAPWTVSGAASKVIINNGTELIVPPGNTLTALVDVNGKLTLQNSTLPTLGTMGSASTVEFAQASPVSIPNFTNDNVTYNNLKLSGAGLKTFKGSATTIAGNLNYDGATNGPLAIEAASVSPFSTINLGGNLTYLGSVTNPSDADSYTLTATSATTQTITGNGNTVRAFRINTGTSGSVVVLSNTGGSTNALLGNASGGGLGLTAGTVFTLNGNNVNFFAGATTVTGTGTITGSPLSNMVINRTGATGDFGTINFTAGAEQLNNLTINNTATATANVTLGTKLDLSGTLTLTAGKLILGGFNISTPTVSGGSSSAYVATLGTGGLKINNIGSAPISYPVGPSAALYHPVTISNTGTVDNYTVNVTHTAPPCSDPAQSVTATWNIAEDVAGGSNCAFTFDYTGAATGASYNPALAQIIHCNGATEDYHNGSVTGTVASGSGFTSFSPFGISNDLIVLPVRITNLRGIAENKFNRLIWTSEQESANSGFEIQRSADGNTFEAIGFVNSAAPGGNSSTALNYTYDDYKPTVVSEYYRLRQVDLNGQSKLSNAVLINSILSIKDGIEAVYPNPAVDKLNVSVISPAHDGVVLTVTDLTGKKLLQQSFNAEASKNILPLNVAKLAPGTYILQLLGSKNVSTIKFIKE